MHVLTRQRVNTTIAIMSDPIFAKYDCIVHVASSIMWYGSSYVSKPGEVLYTINHNNELVAHYFKTNSTVIHHVCGATRQLTRQERDV